MRLMAVILFLIITMGVSAQDKLYIKLYERVGTAELDSVYQEKGKYVQLNTSSITNKDGSKEYMASKDLIEVSPGNTSHSKKIWVCDKAGKVVKFKDSLDFMNFMDRCGYDLVSEKPTKYGAEFTFKRKE